MDPQWDVPMYILDIDFVYSGDSSMYPYQRTPMGNPYKPYITMGIYGYFHPQESLGVPQEMPW